MAPPRSILNALINGTATRGVLLVALLAMISNGGLAASWNVRVRQIDDGLPDNQVTGVVQTPDGYLWVATRGGLVRFNGTDFEPFTLLAQPGVSGIAVREMFADAQGQLWLGANRGNVLRIDRNAAQLFPYGADRPAGEFSGVAEGAQGRVWLAFGSHFCGLNGDQLVELDSPGAAVAAGNASLARDAGGRVWGARGGKIGLLHDGQFEVRHAFDNRPSLLAPTRSGGLWLLLGPQLIRLQDGQEPEVRFTLPSKVDPVCLLEDSSGAVWIGTLAHGLFRFDGKNAEAIKTAHLHVSCLAEDREGNLWAGTFGGGLNLIRRRAFELRGARTGQPFESLTSVCEDATGSAWVITTDGRIFRENGPDWAELPPGDGWPGNDATCIAADTMGMVYTGTHNQGLYAHDLRTGRGRLWAREDGLPGNAIRAVLVATDGTVWFAAGLPGQLCHLAGDRVRVLKQPDGLRVIRAIVQDARGDIWVGTSGGQLLKVRGDELVAEPAMAAQDPISIRSLHAAPDGSLWIGYAGRGIGVLQDGRYTFLAAAQGLTDAPYSQMVADRLGSLWLVGKSGLSRFSLEEAAAVTGGRTAKLQVTRYGRADGLENPQAAFEHSPAAWLGRSGRILLATGTGLLELAPGQLRDNPVIPPVTIERVTMDDRVVARYASRFPLNLNPAADQVDLAETGATLRLPPEHRRLAIDFAALSYAAPENVRYRYRLDGFDGDWTETSHEQMAIYPRLTAGDYTFRVIARNESGVWNTAGASLAISVKPFFTQTLWFRLAVLGGFTALVTITVRFISHRKLRRKVRLLEAQAALDQERARISRDLHDDLGGSVTHIKLLSEIALQESGLPGPAHEYLRLITTTTGRMLNSLDEIVWAVNPLNDTLPNLISYLGQSGLALMRAAGIRHQVDLPDNPPDIPVTSEARHHVLLATKEALTNVVRHAKASSVRLQVTVAGGNLQIEIEDDGQGFDPGRPDVFANGLRNMRQRMESVGGSAEMESRPQQGTRVRIRLPLRTAG